MNRALLIAALGLLGSGCYVSNSSPPNPPQPPSDFGDIAFYWRFQGADGALAGNFTPSDSGCETAAVTTIRILIDGTTQDLSCEDGNGLPGVKLRDFAPGRYSFTILGYRNTEEVFADGGAIDVYAGQLSRADATLTVQGTRSTLPVYYDQDGVLSCSGTSYLAFELDDQYGNVIDFAPTSAPLACGANSFAFLVNTQLANDVLPYGTYRFRYLSLFEQTLGGPVARYQVCGYTFVHQGFGLFISLPPANGTCP